MADTFLEDIKEYQKELAVHYDRLTHKEIGLCEAIDKWDAVLYLHLKYLSAYRRVLEVDPYVARHHEVFDRLWQTIFYRSIGICRLHLQKAAWAVEEDREIQKELCESSDESPSSSTSSHQTTEAQELSGESHDPERQGRREELLRRRQELQGDILQDRWWRMALHSILDTASTFYYDIIIYSNEYLDMKAWEANVLLLKCYERPEQKNYPVQKHELWLRYIQRCYHYIGDIERYRVQIPRVVSELDRPKNWNVAQRDYERAVSTYIFDGRSYHQIGILCSYRGDILRVLSMYSLSQCFHMQSKSAIQSNIHTAIKHYYKVDRNNYSVPFQQILDFLCTRFYKLYSICNGPASAEGPVDPRYPADSDEFPRQGCFDDTFRTFSDALEKLKEPLHRFANLKNMRSRGDHYHISLMLVLISGLVDAELYNHHIKQDSQRRHVLRRLQLELHCVILTYSTNCLTVFITYIKNIVSRAVSDPQFVDLASWFNIPLIDYLESTTSPGPSRVVTPAPDGGSLEIAQHQLDMAVITDIICLWIDLWNNKIELFFRPHRAAAIDRALATELQYYEIADKFIEKMVELVNCSMPILFNDKDKKSRYSNRSSISYATWRKISCQKFATVPMPHDLVLLGLPQFRRTQIQLDTERLKGLRQVRAMFNEWLWNPQQFMLSLDRYMFEPVVDHEDPRVFASSFDFNAPLHNISTDSKAAEIGIDRSVSWDANSNNRYLFPFLLSSDYPQGHRHNSLDGDPGMPKSAANEGGHGNKDEKGDAWPTDASKSANDGKSTTTQKSLLFIKHPRDAHEQLRSALSRIRWFLHSVFVSETFPTLQMPPETGIFTYDSELNRRKRHEESMKRMAELRLKQQVQTLEDNLRKLRLSLQQGDRASLLARQSVQLWIPDTTVWMNYLSTLKKWVKSGGVVLVLTQSVIDGLDQFKKEATDNGLNAREATRFIESVLQHQWSGPRGHPGRISIIVQRPEHSLGSWAKDAPRYIAGGYLINHTPILSRQRSSTQASSFTSSAPQESQPSEQSLQKNVEPNFVTNLHSPIDDPPSLFAINGEGVPPSNPNFRSSVIIASRLKHPEFASSIGTDNSNGVEGLSEKSIGKMMSINENPTSSASASTSCAGSLSPPAPEMAAADNVPLRYRRFLSCAIYYAHVRSPNMSVEQLVTGAPVHTIATHSRDGSGGGGDDNVGNSNNNSNNDRGTVISSVLIISDDEQLQIFAGWFGVECISFMASQARLLEGGNGQQHQQGAPGTTDNNQTDNALSPLILPSNAADVGATNTVPE